VQVGSEGTSGIFTDDSETFRLDNLNSLVNFLPAGTAMNFDCYIETLVKVKLCNPITGLDRP